MLEGQASFLFHFHDLDGYELAVWLLQAICTLIAIAMVHSDNRLASAIAMTLFATGIALVAIVDRRLQSAIYR